jgi:hypothetical protein
MMASFCSSIKRVHLGLFYIKFRMSRQDVEEIIEIIKKELKDLDSNVFVTPVGGYR